ncbi:MAG: pyridoxamine 5'-phosphate oxidase [Candidatus Hydrogenedentes bacterium]|nr:pyridoxamine 5'-phosphate oxidase [Candidatus Hydrogenedentota bacterium]
MAIQDEESPFNLFDYWYTEAAQCDGIEDHTAMTLATTDEQGAPDARQVLLKGFDDSGFVFYTNLTSPKTAQLTYMPRAALCFYWMPLGKQVRIRGAVEKTSDAEADDYFATRPRQSRLGAWASKQSQPLESPMALEKRIAASVTRYLFGPVPRPEFWSGFRVIPEEIEFWLKQPYRLHDRVLYTKTDTDWLRKRLYP